MHASRLTTSLRSLVFQATVAALAGFALAQDPAPPAAPPPPAAGAAPAAVAEVGPEIFYLQDDAGRLVPVPGFRYRDFVELFRMQEGLPGALQPPAAVLESLRVALDTRRSGDTTESTCAATVTCVVRQTRAGWVHVPLELDGLVFSAAPSHEGPGRLLIDADPVRRGYRAWFDAVPEKAGDVRHTFVIEGAVPLENVGGADVVSLRLPVATASVVEITTARDKPEVGVLPAPPPQRVTSRAVDGGSRIEIAGLAGPVRIRVADARDPLVGWEAVPEAAVESVVRIDGRHAFTDATIRLANLPAGLAVARVALPPRTLLRGVQAPSAVVARGGTAEQPTADIAIERAPDGSAMVELQCERPIDPAETKPFEPLGFRVDQVENWRQWGRVSLVVEGEWRVDLPTNPRLRRVDPPANARRQGFVAAFAYDSLPASLPVTVRPRQSRVVIEPEYRYDVGATRITLAARLKVTASGGPVTGVVMAIEPSWAIDEVGPAGLVDTAGVVVEQGTVTIPFLQSPAAEAVVEIRGSKTIARDATQLSLRIPTPKATLVAPAAVIIGSDSAIEILPDAAASVGLTRQSAGGLLRPGVDASQLVYRLDAAQGTFAAARRFLERRVDATLTARAEIDESDIEVRQDVRLDVMHVPLEYVELRVPRAVADSGTLQVRQGGLLLDPFEVAAPAGEPAGQSATVDPAVAGVYRRAILPAPLLGVGELQVSFRLPAPPVPPQTTVAAEVPLVMPVGARVGRQSVSIQTSDLLAVQGRGDAWRRDATSAGVATWVTSKGQDALPVAISARERAAAAGWVVDAAWLRTRLLPDRQENLARYVLSGVGESLTCVVPMVGAAPVAGAAPCDVSLDGGPVPATVREDGSFVVEVSPSADGRPRILEIRTTSGRTGVAESLAMPAACELAAPVFDSGVTQRRFYWEILSRADEHLLGVPAVWTGQQRWRWQAPRFERVPVVTPQALAAWLREKAEATTDDVPDLDGLIEPPLVERRVVYSGLGPPGVARAWLVPTWCLVLVGSGAALALGLLLGYRPDARRPVVVLPLLGLLCVAVAAAPDLAVLVGQAAVPGAALSCVAWLLRAWLDREPARIDVPRTVPPVSASSLTRAVTSPSLIIANSSLEGERSVTGVGRSTP